MNDLLIVGLLYLAAGLAVWIQIQQRGRIHRMERQVRFIKRGRGAREIRAVRVQPRAENTA